ncbi:telomerase protein component 1 [Denticeps clupeoides]|uniref:telomerase protein component 1 n=1 Tax=Denticeps clupeoides TaxID=299321 RepID=UPI0010A3DF00|nr:telomerase protein component 1 [Denticeps clupeoides]
MKGPTRLQPWSGLDQKLSSGTLSTQNTQSLENRILTQTSTAPPQCLSRPPSWLTSVPTHCCPSLQPTRLSSTASALLSAPCISTSPLLSTCNTQLECSLLRGPKSSLTSASQPPPAEEEKGREPGNQVPAQDLQASKEAWDNWAENICPLPLNQHESDDGECEKEDVSVSVDIPVFTTMSVEEDEETVHHVEEFLVPETQADEEMEALKDLKNELLNVVCCSLVMKTCAPGQTDWDDSSVWSSIKTLAEEVSLKDPEFLLKVAVYTRQELNIRITANFLLALAAHLPATKAHLRRYFCKAIQLPSDWLEVTRFYATCFSTSLPSCLKKALVDKFKQFSEYQLAKYNTRKHRCKHNRKPAKAKASAEEWEKWAKILWSDTTVLQNYLKQQGHAAVDKKESEFSMKKMIKRLHIKEPAQFVMAILGKRYPDNPTAFLRSGLSGAWQKEEAGKRMKLQQPDTWERKLSQEGNRAATWEKLIDQKSLPFMAMLRNLRNMITQGISEKHHQKILNRLTSKSSVIQSRQFPFRFLSAYKVIMELSNLAQKTKEEEPSFKEIMKDILKKVPKSGRYRRMDWSTAKRRRLRGALGVPFVYRLYNMRKKILKKAGQRLYSEELLSRYRAALETAVQISCRHNIPPLPGRTLVLCTANMYSRNSLKMDFCCPPDPENKDEEDTGLTPSILEMAVLLSLMIVLSCEKAQFVTEMYGTKMKELEVKSDVLLDNIRPVLKQVQDFIDMDYEEREETYKNFFTNMIAQNNRVDRIILLTDSDYDCEEHINRYRKQVNNDILVVQVCLTKVSEDSLPVSERNIVKLHGFSEQILKFIAERGSARLLQHVELMDKLHGVPPLPQRPEVEQEAAARTLLPPTPRFRWRCVRVFISSTFRDMHSERDVLLCSVFPELRRRAAAHCLYLQEVDLRWGITEEDSSRATELCLAEICRSQLLLGILGERYGLIPPHPPSLPNLAQHSWLDSAPPGLSVTAMEILQFQAMYPNDSQNRMLFYFRSPHLSRSVPAAWKADFAPESRETESKMASMKRRILESGAKVTENYPCEWGGVVDGRPCVKGLEQFSKAVQEDLWESIMKLFVKPESNESDHRSEIVEQEAHQEAQQQRFFGRGKLVSTAMEKLVEVQKKGGLLLLDAGSGEGKTVFMAGLAKALESANKSPNDVVFYSTAASQSSRTLEHMLRCLVYWLRKRQGNEEKLPTTSSYKDLMNEFKTLLSEVKKGQSLVLLIDGVDVVVDRRGKVTSEWIPHHLLEGVSLVLSVTSNSALHQTIQKKKVSSSVTLGPLSLPDRKDIVQNKLQIYGKKLSDSAFNNQLQTLLMKKGAVSPLYLHFACEELRNYGSFEKMKENLQALPHSVPQLVQGSLLRLESQYSGLGLGWALGVLAVSKTGLRERDLFSVLEMCCYLSKRGQRSWQEAVHLARNPHRCIPMATCSQIAQHLQSIIGLSDIRNPEDYLTLTHPEVRSVFADLFLSQEEDRHRAHLVMSAHLWVCSDPLGKGTFLNCDAESLSHLPLHLMVCGQGAALSDLLSSYDFLYASVRHGFLHHLLEMYSMLGSNDELEIMSSQSFLLSGWKEELEIMGSWSVPLSDEMVACHSFLKRHAPLLSYWPALFVQQALNEPDGNPAHSWACGMIGKGGVHAVKQLNKAEQPQQAASELIAMFPSEPTCLVMSPEDDIIAVGTGQGTLYFIDRLTGREVRSVITSCDGISGCTFLKDGLVGSTSFDGQIELWDIESGCRTGHVDAHSNRITGSDVSPDRKCLATVSLDCSVNVWSCPQGNCVATLSNPSPLNCVAFDSEGQCLAVGCWDGRVHVWRWLQENSVQTLTGHQHSVRSVVFSPSSSLLCSGSLCGEVRLWSIPAMSSVGCYQAHSGSVQALSFLNNGALLLSAGDDRTVQLWSAGLGRLVGVLGEQKSSRQKRKVASASPAALSVAVTSGYSAVGYQGDGLKLYNLNSGERVWSSEDLRVSVLCLMWLPGEDRLVSGNGDNRLRVWLRDQGRWSLQLKGAFGVQQGPITALAQNATYLASSSDDFTVVLWSLEDMTCDPWVEPVAVCVLRGHSGGVTCLSFNPSGQELLSGGKDQALMVWKVDSLSATLSWSIAHCHGDWITGCAWTSAHLISCSTDGSVCVWDAVTTRCVRKILTACSLSALCCQGDCIIASSADGLLLLWNWDTGAEMTRIQAHQSRIHYCTTVPDTHEEVHEDRLMVATASEDGSVKLWCPLQVHHHSTLHEHSAGVDAVACGQEGFFTVSEDRSLRTWSLDIALASPAETRGAVTSACFLDDGQMVAVGTPTGIVEIWQQNTLVCRKKVSKSGVTALTSMQQQQLAVGCWDCSVSVWKLHCDPESGFTSLEKVESYTAETPARMLSFCNMLLALCDNGSVVRLDSTEDSYHRSMNRWLGDTQTLDVLKNDGKSIWLLGEKKGTLTLGIMLCMSFLKINYDKFCDVEICHEASDAAEKKGVWITAATMQGDLIVCGDLKGNVWCNQPPNLDSWDTKILAHADRVSVLRLTDTTIISASRDRTVKIWNRHTRKQVGMFVCEGPVTNLELNPSNSREMVCGDALGRLYFLSWTE